MLKFKPGVNPIGANPPVTLAIVCLNDIFQLFKHDLMITSILDGTHDPKSYHRFGMAFDFRTHGITKGELTQIADVFKEACPMWDIVIEVDHGHVEYDPK